MSEQAHGAAGGLSVEGMPAWQYARRQRIVAAALESLGEQEYEQIQIRDVAQSAEVALGTLYRYFSSKEHLYAAVLQEWAAFGRTRGPRGTATGPEDRIRRRAHAIIRAIERQPQFFKVYVLLQTSGDVNARALLAEFADTAQASLARELDALPPREAEDGAIMLWSIVHTLITEAIYRDGSMREVHRIVDRFIDLLVPQLT
jgi:TetR/AcrR family transcriptional regulator, cholesterol catabolism regulator